jgi:hypothetical protein
VAAYSGSLPLLTKGWTLNGLVSLQSGRPFNLIDLSGAIASVNNSKTVNISDPIMGFIPGTTVSQLELQGSTGIDPNKPLIDASVTAFTASPVREIRLPKSR